MLLTKPDVALLDLNMPELDGIAATRELARVAPRVAVLVLTMHEDDEAVFAAMRAGASGYLVKGVEQDDIARAIRSVAAGEAIFGQGVAQRVLFVAAGTAPRRGRVPGAHGARAGDPRSARSGVEQRSNRAPGGSRRRRWRTTSPRSSPSSRSPTGRRPSCLPVTPGWVVTEQSWASRLGLEWGHEHDEVETTWAVGAHSGYPSSARRAR